MSGYETGSAPGHTYTMVERTAMADPNQLSRQERYLVHQIHPAKLATNVSFSMGLTMLF